MGEFSVPAMMEEVRRLFRELAGQPAEERARLLAEQQVRPEVRAEVESLLRFDAGNASSLSACVADAAYGVLRSAAAVSKCGPYRLVRRLGSGGMGAVYLGERNDGEIRQQVAVKLLGAEGNRPGWRERFLRERQLLASLHHSSIVHVIDAGHTDDGQPFLVMEYVEGTPIDAYAERLALRARLALFLRVCEAVSHAHQHLIIHRDLKPSNILVDQTGQPKLLDFGLAKLLDDTGDATHTLDRLLTPHYASPEQFRGELQTTSTDIYSLGAVLYKLLTGRSPHEGEATPAVRTGDAAVARPSRLNPDIPADLDFIVCKALRAEPQDRYVSAEAFANDVRAFLESRPVSARAGNAGYRTRKFLRRYWVPVAAALLVFGSLSTGLYVANRERATAQQRFQQLRQLSNRVFDLDKVIRDLPGSTQARERLITASVEYLSGLAADARGDLDLMREVAQGYWRVALVQGVPSEINLGEPAKAELSLQKADELIDTVLASRPRDRSALYTGAAIAEDRMILAQEAHRNQDALAYAHKAAARTGALLRLGAVANSERDSAAVVYGNIALAHINMHLYADAIPYARRSLDLARQLPGQRFRVAQALSLLANAQRYQGDLAGALEDIQEARRIADQAVYPNDILRAFDEYGVLLREGFILGEEGGVNLGRPADAVEPLRQALDLAEQSARKDPNDSTSRGRVGNSGNALGNVLRHRDPRQALAVYDLAMRRLREVPHSVPERRRLALVLANSSYALRGLHRPGEAKQRLDAAFAILGETGDYPAARVKLDSDAYVALCARADYYAGQGDSRRALSTYRQLLDKVIAAKPDALNDLRDAPRLSSIYAAIDDLCRRTGDPAGADQMAATRLELWRQWDRKLPNNPFVRRQLAEAQRPQDSPRFLR